MKKIINAYGTAMDFDAAIELMDDKICEELANSGDYETEQEFFDAYCARHADVFGEEFELAKENPVW